MSISFEHMEHTKETFSTLKEVREAILTAAKKAEEAGRHDSLVFRLPNVKYPLDEPFVLSVKENPELAHVDITLRGDGEAEVTSLVRLNGKEFIFPKGKTYATYQFPKSESGEGAEYPLFNEFFLNFKRIPKSKSESFFNLDSLTEDERNGVSKREGFWAPIELAKKVASDEIGATELVMYTEWCFSIFHVEKIDLSKTRVESGKTYALVVLKDGEMDNFCTSFLRHLNIKNREMFFQNCPALLETNTFAYDYHKGKLYVNAAMPEYMWCHALEYPALETLFEIEGVRNLTIEGIRFRGATCKHGCKKPYHSDLLNIIYTTNSDKKPHKQPKAAAIFARDVRRLTVQGCSFLSLGTNAVQVVDKSVRTHICDSVFEDIGMSGICIGNPTREWEEINKNYGIRIENNYLKNIAFDYPAAAAIYVGLADGVKVLHNTVDNCAYTALSVGWISDPVLYELGERFNVRSAELAYNYFHNFMQTLVDGGAIYVVGANASRESTDERFNRMHHNVAIRDTYSPHNRCGYYLDGSATNWEVSDSVVIGIGEIPIYSQHHPGALSYHNTFRNIYSSTPHGRNVQVPFRDIVTLGYHLVEEGEETLYEKFPEAKAIRDAAGAKIIV